MAKKSSMAGFEGKNFYLDLENSPQIKRQLMTFITELGGEMRQFLDQRVKYIITSRPKDQWPPKRPGAGKGRPSMTTMDVLKDPSIQSPINLNKNSSFSRGSLLLSRCQQMVSKPTLPTDVLELARLWNITIMRAIDVLQFCQNHLSPVQTDSSTVDPKQIKRLKGPYIKVEDSRLKHRPIYKEFYVWPQINYDFEEYLCPFVKRKVQNETMDEPIESLEGLAVNDRLNHTINDNKTHKNCNKIKTKYSPKNQTLVKKSLIKKRRTLPFCEICGTDFEDLSEHLKNEIHVSYTKNEDNYRELKGVIQSLPNPFQESDICLKSVHSVDRSDSDTEEELLCSPFQSTPNMSTTIQLCGSKHKSHFLSIHDLIGNKSPQEVDDHNNGLESDVVPNGLESDAVPTELDSSATEIDYEFIPPSITSPDTKGVQKINDILNNSSNDSNQRSGRRLDDINRTNCSEEL